MKKAEDNLDKDVELWRTEDCANETGLLNKMGRVGLVSLES